MTHASIDLLRNLICLLSRELLSESAYQDYVTASLCGMTFSSL